MKKILLIIAAFGVFSIQADDMKFGVGYTISSWDDIVNEGDSLSLGSLELTAFKSFDNGFAAEVGVAEGVSDDSLGSVTAELDTSFFVRGFYNINDNFYVNAIWGNIEATATAGALSASASDTDLGFGVGVMFSIPNSDNMFRLGYEDIDEMSQVSLKFLF